MADQPSSTAAKKSKKRNIVKHFRDLIKRPKSANDSASQSGPAQVSVSSASGAHDPVPGNDAGSSAELTTSSGNATLNQDPTASFQSLGPPSSSVPDLLGSGLGQEEDNRETSLTQTQVSDWKVTALKVTGRFAQTLLKKLPQCVDTNPVKMAFSIAKVIIEIKDAVGDNKDELAQRLEETANRLLAVERMVVSGVPKGAEEAMEKFKSILGEEMKELMDLADKSLATRILDHEAYGAKIQQVFQQVKEATTSFFLEMAINIQKTASEIRDDTKKAALERLCPSEKADHKTVLEGQGLKREACTEGTRVKILEDITKWANDHSLASPRVFWLTGQAGSGKTTILYTIAKRFEVNANQHTVLGANFLCSRQFQETQAQTRIIPTIAYHLTRKCKSYADALHVADKFDAVNYDVATQLRDLLVGPWQQSEGARGPQLPPYLIAIDALDEIKGEGGSAFLRDLLKAIDKYDLRGLKFLVTSRSDPELVQLCEAFTSEAVCRLQDVPIEEAKSDIETYLKTKLPMLADRPELAELVRRAGGLFIYAATAVKYLTRRASITARSQTDMLSDLLSKSYEPASACKATFLIDELYRQIMCDAFSELEGKFLTRRLRILYTFLCTAERTSTSVVAALVLDVDDEEARAVLRDLHAVLYTQDDRVYWYHASFPDFIFDRARSNFHIGEKDFAFWCNEPDHHNLLGESCFRVMKSGLRFNMGNITSSFLFDHDNAVVLSEHVNQNISDVLRYSSRHWTHHLPSPQLVVADTLCRCISDFLQIRVLFWIEAMNLLGSRNQCTPILQHARQWVLKCGNSYSELAHDVGEAANFSTYFSGSPAAESTPHLYISSLATWLQDTSLSRKWKNQFSRIPVFTHTKGNIDLPLMTIQTGRASLAVAFSSDGRRIVSGLSEGWVQVWDASTGAELKVLKGHTHWVNSVAFSSDGTQFVSGSCDESVRVWDASTGAELKVLEGHTHWVNSVAFSSNGTRIVSGSQDRSVRVWDVSTGVELKVLQGHTGKVTSVAFSSDGTRIVSGSHDNSVRVWDASTGVELKELKGHIHGVTSVAFSSDGTRIVSGSYDDSIRVWDASTGAELKVFEGHTRGIFSVMFSSDGTRIVSGSLDGPVQVWDASTGAELKVLKGHVMQVSSVAFSSDSTRIVSGSHDKSVRVWDASKGAELKVLKGHTGWVDSVAFSSDGTRIVSGSYDESVRVWDASTGAELKVLKGYTGEVTSVAFLSDGMQIVSGESVRVWDASTGAELKGDPKWVKSVAFSSDGTRVVSGSFDGSVRVWDASTGAELNVHKNHTDSVTSVVFSGDGTRIVSGSMDGSVRVWDTSTGAELKVLKGHTYGVTSVASSGDGTQIVSGSDDESVRVWDASTGAELKVLKGHTGEVTSVAFSSDGTRVVSGSDDNSVQVWDASTGAVLNVLNGHTSRVTSVAFSSDGTRVVSGSDDNSVQVWDASTGAVLNVLNGHTSGVTSVAFSSDGTRVVSGSYDESVQVWDVSIGDEHFAWNLADTNWIISSQGQDHLMWVPQSANLPQPFNILVISRSGFGFAVIHHSYSTV